MTRKGSPASQTGLDFLLAPMTLFRSMQVILTEFTGTLLNGAEINRHFVNHDS